LAARRCTICGKHFRPDPRARRQQRCCSRRCSKKLKRQRDRRHKQRYRETGLGKEQRKRENQTQRERLGWNDYMRFWRKAEPKERSHQERERARRYYQAHRDEILAKRRQQRAGDNADQNQFSEACSH
jgi:hypothetical protein